MLQKKDEQLAKKDEQLATVLAQHREDLRRKDEQLLDCLAKKDEQYCEDLRRKDEQLERMIQQAVGAHAVQTSPVPTCSPQHQKQHTTEARRAQSSQTQKGEAAPAPVSARNTNKQVLQTDCHVNKDEALLASMLSMQDGDSADDDIVDALTAAWGRSSRPRAAMSSSARVSAWHAYRGTGATSSTRLAKTLIWATTLSMAPSRVFRARM